MKNVLKSLSVAALLAVAACSSQTDSFVENNFKFIENQLPVAFSSIDSVQTALKSSGRLKSGVFAQSVVRTINKNGSLHLVGANDWTCGFFPGLLWYTYEYSGDPIWKEKAIKYTATIEMAKTRTNTHDLGFMLYCSFGNGYRLTGDSKYKEVLIEGANSLITRFDEKIGLIRSWDFNADKWNYPVIIDNMMNLEMLCEVTKLTGDQKYMEIAKKHADKTIQNHFRPDYSSYHVVDYDSVGVATKHITHQGYSNSSAWARGQGWGLYGYTMMYRETGDEKYLVQANHIANFILTHPNLPADKVPYWDFNAPNIPNEPRDVSAATLIASALYELSGYNIEKCEEYRVVADTILESVSKNYLAKKDGDYGFVTTQSVGSFPSDTEVSVPLSYADYYFAEALIRRERGFKF
ncbi:MAG: glycoside hydrolase family 88 protein [Rikenellaceae bacterium]